MANNAESQQALADDITFRRRLVAALSKVAWQVLTEDPGTAHHAQRVELAQQVLTNVAQYAADLAPSFVMRTNVVGFTTSYDFHARAVVTASGDPDLESQLANDWNNMAGVAA